MVSAADLNTAFCYLCSGFLALANFIWLLLGIACIALGSAWQPMLNSSRLDSQEHRQLADYLRGVASMAGIEDVATAAGNALQVVGPIDNVLLGLGIGLTLLAILGFGSLCCRSRPGLAAYLVILSMLFFAQILVLILLYGSPDTFHSLVRHVLNRCVAGYQGMGAANGESLLLNAAHIYIGCCGARNGSDFQASNLRWNRSYTSTQFRKTFTFNVTYPVSCCQFDLASLELRDKFCPITNLHFSNHKTGCSDQIVQLVGDYFERNYILQSLAAIVVIQALLIAGILVIFHDITERNSKVHPAVNN